MSEKILEEIEDSPDPPAEPVRRLCSEIQLFDLCELEKCSYKSDKFCTDQGLLTRFERIADEDAGARINLSDEDIEEDDEFGGFGFDDDDESNDFAEEDE